MAAVEHALVAPNFAVRTKSSIRRIFRNLGRSHAFFALIGLVSTQQSAQPGHLRPSRAVSKEGASTEPVTDTLWSLCQSSAPEQTLPSPTHWKKVSLVRSCNCLLPQGVYLPFCLSGTASRPHGMPELRGTDWPKIFKAC